MGRSPCCDENGLKKGPWTPEEDQKLVDFIQKRGHGSWRALPKLAGLNRCGKSCRLRWTNYLRPDIKRGKFSPEEEQIILNLHSILGNKWSAIATHLPGRTDNEIKNFWNTHLKKKLIQMGFDPMTHRPRTDVFAALPGLLALANLCDLVDRRPWDDHSLNLRSSESNIHQSAQLQYFQYLLQSAANNVAQNQTSLSPSNSNYMINNSTMPNSHLDLDLDLDIDLPEPQFGGGDQEFEQQIMQPCYDANDQLDCSGFDDAFFGQGENGSLLGLESLPPLITDGSVGPTSSSEGSDGSGLSSFWAPELLLHDPFTTEFF